ncbi:MAG: M1 family metallopeptidase [Bacteroidetes Order II. Incertae sedis bacterium]|nr:M1 family metallopeptidase [Bacteroidetes Order II. bacterium]
MNQKIAYILFLFGILSFVVYAQDKPKHATTESIDLAHYKIHLALDWEKKRVLGKVEITLSFTTPSNSIQLAANQLLIHEIYAEDQQLSRFTLDKENNILQIDLNKTYQKGDSLKLNIRYETTQVNEPDPNNLGGSFGKGVRFFSPTTTNPIKRKQAWSQSEWQHHPYWLPGSLVLSDLATTELMVTVETPLTVIANGVLVGQTENSDQTRTFHYKTSHPHPLYLTSFVVGEYQRLVQHYQETPLYTYCYPDEKEAATATIVRLPEMMRFLMEKTGFQYPFSHYTQVVVQNYPFPSLTGQQAMSIISDNMIDDYGTHEDFQYLWDGVEFNALASQWFGNIIIPKNVRDIWLTKAFAQYFEGLFTAHIHKEAEYQLWYYPWEASNIWNEIKADNPSPIVPKEVEQEEAFTKSSAVKYRGAWILRMLQRELGDQVFFKAIQVFIKENAFKPVSTEDFVAVIQRVSPKDLKWFFDQWIYQAQYPIFKVTKEINIKRNEIKLIFKQIQKLNNQPLSTRFFRGILDIEIEGIKKSIWIKPQETTTIVYRFSQMPHYINIDPHQIWLKEVQYNQNTEALLTQLKYSPFTSSRNTAFFELVNIYKADPMNKTLQKRLLDAVHEVLQSKAYWRFRFNVLGQLQAVINAPFDPQTTRLLTDIIKKDRSWVKAAALSNLGNTQDSTFAPLYLSNLNDLSDRVVNAAAIALGKTKVSHSFLTLTHLKTRPSWKNQSLMHALNGLVALGDTKAESFALEALTDLHTPRWFLGNGWDFPLVAVQTLTTLGKTEKAYAMLSARLNQSLQEGSVDDIFYHVLLLTTLGNPKAKEIFAPLKARYHNNPNILSAIEQFEAQLK